MDYTLTMKPTIAEAQLIRKALLRFATQHSQRVEERPAAVERKEIDAETTMAKRIADTLV